MTPNTHDVSGIRASTVRTPSNIPPSTTVLHHLYPYPSCPTLQLPLQIIHQLSCLPQTLLVIWTLFQPVSSNLVWMYSSNLSPLSSTCHCLKDLSQLPSSMLLSNLCSKNTTYLKMNSSNLKSEFYFKGFGTYHSCSYIITFGVIPINHSLPICISLYPK